MVASRRLLIRPAGAGDLDSLARLRWEFRTDGAVPVEGREEFLARFRTDVGQALAVGRWRAWVAAVGEAVGEVVGHVYAARIDKLPNPVDEPETHLYLSNLYVCPRYRGAGVGSLLLAAALESGDGADAAILWGRPEAAGLYHRHGFLHSTEILQRRPLR